MMANPAAVRVSSVVAGGSKNGQAAEVGHQIFVYNNIRTSQVVYSLTRSLNNTRALKQIPFAGKKTVPAALRRDLWTPLCVLSFPNSHQGLSAYRKLREFKHLHEVAYPLSTVTQKDGPRAGNLMSKKEKSRIIMDQKANAIADIAAVLAIQARQPRDEELAKAVKRVTARKGMPKPKYGPGSWTTSDVLEFQGNVDGVSVWWANPTDAEFAETWPEPVRHGPLAVARYTAVWPPPEEVLLGKKLSEVDHIQDGQEIDGIEEQRKSSKFNLFGVFSGGKQTDSAESR